MKEARRNKKHGKRYKEEKPGHSIFGKISFPVVFALGLGLITPYCVYCDVAEI